MILLNGTLETIPGLWDFVKGLCKAGEHRFDKPYKTAATVISKTQS